MKLPKWSVILVLAAAACGPDPEPAISQDEIVGFWMIESATINGKDSEPFVNSLLTANYLHLKSDQVAGRAYTWGKWTINNRTLSVTWDYGVDFNEEYKVITLTKNQLILEHQMPTSDFTSLKEFEAEFGMEEFVTIRRTYRLGE
jgi:Lipocalin-like domain